MVCNQVVEPSYFQNAGLNPYSTGIWSATLPTGQGRVVSGLNPYSTGIWSATSKWIFLMKELTSLNPYSTGIWSATTPCGVQWYIIQPS